MALMADASIAILFQNQWSAAGLSAGELHINARDRQSVADELRAAEQNKRHFGHGSGELFMLSGFPRINGKPPGRAATHETEGRNCPL